MICNPKPIAALAVLGAYWHATANPEPHARLARRGDRYVCSEFAEDLSREEALGLTLAIRWAELDDRGEAVPLVARDNGGWLVALPGEPARVLSAAVAVDITRALLQVRRVIRPCSRPFAPRDHVAELLQLRLRELEAQLRGPTPVEILRPPTILSDLGRDWSGCYHCHG